MSLHTSLSLHGILKLDAGTCVGMGALLAIAAGPIAGLTALPGGLLFWAGLALLPIAAYMLWVATRDPVPISLAWTIVAGNVAWIAGSLLLLATPSLQPNALGIGFVAIQAVGVAGLTWLEWAALRTPAPEPRRT